MNEPSVGRSISRTPLKHWILKNELGRIAGIFAIPNAAWKVPAKANPFHVIDLCAGDGCDIDGLNSSPQIILKHLGTLKHKGGDVKATFIERQPKTCESLRSNTPTQSWSEVLHMDAREYDLQCKPMQAVFIHSDPNHIGHWPITPRLMDAMSETTTMLCTLGCNVGGLKRLSIDERRQWYSHVRIVVDAMPGYHDALLVMLEGDSAQWAYLLRLPDKWSLETAQRIIKSGAKYTSYTLKVSSYRHHGSTFRKLEDHLFLTAKERTQ